VRDAPFPQMAEMKQVPVAVQAQFPDGGNIVAVAHVADAESVRLNTEQFRYRSVYIKFSHCI